MCSRAQPHRMGGEQAAVDHSPGPGPRRGPLFPPARRATGTPIPHPAFAPEVGYGPQGPVSVSPWPAIPYTLGIYVSQRHPPHVFQCLRSPNIFGFDIHSVMICLGVLVYLDSRPQVCYTGLVARSSPVPRLWLGLAAGFLGPGHLAFGGVPVLRNLVSSLGMFPHALSCGALCSRVRIKCCVAGFGLWLPGYQCYGSSADAP